MSQIQALAAKSAKGKLEPFSYDPGPLSDDDVEISVEYCGLCHSDLTMLNNDIGFSQYPLVPGHEAIGKITALGSHAKFLKIGQTVGLGWNSSSCLHCAQCLSGSHNMCSSLGMTIVGRPGAFATKVRCHWVWATPIPEGIDISKAGPLLCGGITVFNPFVQFDIRPTARVGIVGIGGLGHMALQFANKWGCDVTAFTSSAGKADEARAMGAHHIIDTHSGEELAKAAGSFDFILSTVNVVLDWPAYIRALGPKGRMNVVGLLTEPMPVSSIDLLMAQRSVSGTPSGPPSVVNQMLDFCARHNIAPVTEQFPMSHANEALEHLLAGKARYRIVLKQDFN
jgi:alcohol/geraniol dehydrogenase (NADP+)